MCMNTLRTLTGFGFRSPRSCWRFLRNQLSLLSISAHRYRSIVFHIQTLKWASCHCLPCNSCCSDVRTAFLITRLSQKNGVYIMTEDQRVCSAGEASILNVSHRTKTIVVTSHFSTHTATVCVGVCVCVCCRKKGLILVEGLLQNTHPRGEDLHLWSWSRGLLYVFLLILPNSTQDALSHGKPLLSPRLAFPFPSNSTPGLVKKTHGRRSSW